MNHYHLTLQTKNRPETLERILRIIRHRGFHLSSIHMEENHETQKADLSLSLKSTRPIDMLTSHLHKLIDITQLTIRN